MNKIITLLEDLSYNGFGVTWHEGMQLFRPFIVRSDAMMFWRDAAECASVDFEEAVRLTHARMKQDAEQI